MIFLGKPVEYWVALDELPRELDVERLITEIAELRGKVAFYESRVVDMYGLMDRSG